MARNKRVKTIEPVDLLTDMVDLLDLAGVDAIDKPHLDNILHHGISPQALLEYASAMHRQSARRIQYKTLIEAFMGNGK